MQNASACYGRMFPSIQATTTNLEVRGQVFGYRVEHTGVVASRRSVTTDHEAWARCASCPDFESCFHLSTGTLLMEVALKH
jgi:hypothetical protein